MLYWIVSLWPIRGEFNNVRACDCSLFLNLSLFVICKAWHQYNKGLKTLALLNLHLLSQQEIKCTAWKWNKSVYCFRYIIGYNLTDNQSLLIFRTRLLSIWNPRNRWYQGLAMNVSWPSVINGKYMYCPASQEWQQRHVLVTTVLGTYNR